MDWNWANSQPVNPEFNGEDMYQPPIWVGGGSAGGEPVGVQPPPVFPGSNFEEQPVVVFVGNICPDLSDGTVHACLETCGRVVSWKRAVDAAAGGRKLKPYGFCTFESAKATLWAIRVLHDYNVGSRKLVVKVDGPSRRLLEAHLARPAVGAPTAADPRLSTDDDAPVVFDMQMEAALEEEEMVHNALRDCRANIDEMVADALLLSERQRVDVPVVRLSLPAKKEPPPPKLTVAAALPKPTSSKKLDLDKTDQRLTAAKVKPEFHFLEAALRQDVQLKRGDAKSADLWQDHRCVVCRAKIYTSAAWKKHAATAPHERRMRVSEFLENTDAYESREGCQPSVMALRDGSEHYLGKECIMEFQDGYGAYLLWACYVCCVAGISPNGIVEHMKTSHHQLAYMNEFYSEWTPSSQNPKELAAELDKVRKSNKFGLKAKPQVVRLSVDAARVFTSIELTVKPSKAAAVAATAERPKILHDTPTAVILWCENCWEALIITKASQCFDDVWIPHLQTESHAQAKLMRPTLTSINRSALLGAQDALIELSQPVGAGGWANVDGQWRYNGGSRYLGVEHLVERYVQPKPDVVCLICAAATPLLPDAVVAHVTSEGHIVRYLQYELRDDASALCELGAARKSAPTLHGWVNRFLYGDGQKGRLDQGAVAVFDPNNVRRRYRPRAHWVSKLADKVQKNLVSKVNLTRDTTPRPLFPPTAAARKKLSTIADASPTAAGVADMEIDEEVGAKRLKERQTALVTIQQLMVASWHPMDANVADAMQYQLSACKEPLVGLENVKAVYQGLALKCYLCDTCNSLQTAASLANHLCSFDHRLEYKERCGIKLPVSVQRTEIEERFDKVESLDLAKSYMKGWARLVESCFATPRRVAKHVSYAGEALDCAIAVSQSNDFDDGKYQPQVCDTMEVVARRLRKAKKEKIDSLAKRTRPGVEAALRRLRDDIKSTADEPLLGYEAINEVCTVDDRQNLWRCYYCNRCKALMMSMSVIDHLKSEQHRHVCFGLWARHDDAAKDSARLYLLRRRIAAASPGAARANLLRHWAELLEAETGARRDAVRSRLRYEGSRNDLRHELQTPTRSAPSPPVGDASKYADVWICDPCGHINWDKAVFATSVSRCDLCERSRQPLSMDNLAQFPVTTGGSLKKRQTLLIVEDIPDNMSVVVTGMFNMCGTVVKVQPGKQSANGLLFYFSDADGVLTALSLLPGWRVKPHNKPLVVKVTPTTRDTLVAYINLSRRVGLTNLKYHERMQPIILKQKKLRSTLLQMSSTAEVDQVRRSAASRIADPPMSSPSKLRKSKASRFDTIVPPNAPRGPLKRLGAEMMTAGVGGHAPPPLPQLMDNSLAGLDYGQLGQLLLEATQAGSQLPVSASRALADLFSGGAQQQQQQQQYTAGLPMQSQAFGNQAPFGLGTAAPPPMAYQTGALGLDPTVAAVLKARQLQMGSQPPPPSALVSSAYSRGVGQLMTNEQQQEQERLAAQQAQLTEQRKMLAEEQERLRLERERYLADQQALTAERAASQEQLREAVLQEQLRRDALRQQLLSLTAGAPPPQPPASMPPAVATPLAAGQPPVFGSVRNEDSMGAEQFERTAAAALQQNPPRNAEDLLLTQRIISQARSTSGGGGGGGGGAMAAQPSGGRDSVEIIDVDSPPEPKPPPSRVEPVTTNKERRVYESKKADERQTAQQRRRSRSRSRSPSRKRGRRSRSRDARPTDPRVHRRTGRAADANDGTAQPKSRPAPTDAQPPATMQTAEKRGAAPITGFAAAASSSATSSETMLMGLLEQERDASRQQDVQQQALLNMLAQAFSGQPQPPAQTVAPRPPGLIDYAHGQMRGGVQAGGGGSTDDLLIEAALNILRTQQNSQR